MNSNPLNELNRPIWNSASPSFPSKSAGASRASGAFQEVWYLKLNDPASQRALWLRMTLLISANGFRQVAETWAVYFQRGANREVSKLALKQTHDLKAFQASPQGFGDGGIRIGDCEFSGGRIRGRIQSKGRSMSWDLSLASAQEAHFNLVPEALRRSGLVRNTAVTAAEDLVVNGTTEITDERGATESIAWANAAGMQAHLSGPKSPHSWVWGHCNLFVGESGRPVPFVFEGLSARARLIGPLPSPRLSTFYFLYEGKPYAFNSLWESLRVKSAHSLTEWSFQADRGDLSFRGKSKAEHKDFAGLTYEDTNGSLLYCANSKLSDLQIHVYRRGKLENSFYSNGMAAFEVVSRQKNPYVPLLV